MGTIGNIVVVPGGSETITANRAVSIIRLKRRSDFDPYYVALYLDSRIGTILRERESQGGIQQRINLEGLKRVRIPVLPIAVQSEVKKRVISAEARYRERDYLYLQAERMVLMASGWDKLNLSQPKWWTPNLAQAQEVHRLDAEHFQPKYDKLIARLKRTGKAKQLGDIAPYIKRGLQPEYVADGEIIVVNSQHLGRYLLNVEATERTDRKFWEVNKRSRLRKHDVLVYSTGAYVGRTNVWLENQDGIASNHVTIIRPNVCCDPLYLAVFLNASVGVLQTERWASGSGQRELYPDCIERFFVYLPDQKFQGKIADLVRESHIARQKAKLLLEQAKAKVEALIEERTN